MRKRFAGFPVAGFWGIFLLFSCARPERVRLMSPDGRLEVTIFSDTVSHLSYAVRLDGKSLVDISPLGIVIDGTDLGQGPRWGRAEPSEWNERLSSRGNHDTAVNHYKKLLIPFTSRSGGRLFWLEARAFDGGFAFRYIIPGGPGRPERVEGEEGMKEHAEAGARESGKDQMMKDPTVKGQTGKGLVVKGPMVNGESTGWRLPAGSTLWFQENIQYYEGLYDSCLVTALGKRHIGPPASFRTPDGLYGSITEAALYNYSGLSLRSDSTGLLHADFVNDPAGWRTGDTIVSPWRVILAGADLNSLVNTDLVSCLNPAPARDLADADWIKPGRAAWSYFQHGNVTVPSIEREYIDKAALLGFEYNMVDAGWESAWPAKWDTLARLVEYGRARKVGIWVWKSYPSLKDDSVRKDFFRRLHTLGVAGVKIDFIDREGIEQVRFYQKALEDAAVCHLMVDFHGADKPTGYNRRYPHELTREAIYGQEWRTFTPKGAAHNTILPFTRFLAGPADADPGVFHSDLSYGTSRAHQLSLTIIFHSPLIVWPEDPALYLSSPAAEIIQAIPPVWDETIVLPVSRIGETAAFARRKGGNWFIGICHAGPAKAVTVPLGFLGPGEFERQQVSDDLIHPDSILYTRTGCDARDTLHLLLRPDGGYAAMFTRKKESIPRLSIMPAGGYLQGPVRAEITASPGRADGSSGEGRSRPKNEDSGSKGRLDGDWEIRYTFDGSEPSVRSALYTGPLLIGRPLQVRAGLFKNGQPLAPVLSVRWISYPAPLLEAPTSLFTDRLGVRIGFPRLPDGYRLPGGADADRIVYTLDGRDPDVSSHVYDGPLVFDSSVAPGHSIQLKARVLFAHGMAGGVAERTFRRVVPSSPVKPGARPLLPGLRYSYYEGDWEKIPGLSSIKPVKQGTVGYPSLDSVASRNDHYAIRFEGMIDIPETGVYRFFSLSDDGSRLYVDDERVVDNDGSHGDLEKSGDKALAAGKHSLRVDYWQNASGRSLKLYIEGLSGAGSGMKKQEIPAGMLFRP